MNEIWIEVAVIVVLLLINATFSMSEMAIVSSRKSFLQRLINTGSNGSKEALKLMDSPSHFLSTIQIGITTVGVLSGAFGGATISEKLGVFFERYFSLSPEVSEGIGVAIIVTIITFFSVVFGELVPKRLALIYPEKIASIVAPTMNKITKCTWPIVWIFSHTTETVLKLLGLRGKDNSSPVSHDEVKEMVAQGEKEGVFDKEEKTMMNKVLGLSKKRSTSVMTPVRNIIWLDIDESPDLLLLKIQNNPHSYYPVAKSSLDNLFGTVHIKELYTLKVSLENISKVIKKPLFIPESTTALRILELFKKSGVHSGYVLDEFGGVLGMVTLNDILENIVGDIPTQGIREQESIMQMENGSWLIDGSLPIEEFMEKFELGEMGKFASEKEKHFRTVAGFVIQQLGHIPLQTDFFIWKDWRFEVVDMDRNRVDKVLVTSINSSISNYD